MPRTINAATLTQQIQSLIKLKAKHSEALRVIEQTLEQIQRLLGTGSTASMGNGTGPDQPHVTAPAKVGPVAVASAVVLR